MYLLGMNNLYIIKYHDAGRIISHSNSLKPLSMSSLKKWDVIDIRLLVNQKIIQNLSDFHNLNFLSTEKAKNC